MVRVIPPFQQSKYIIDFAFRLAKAAREERDAQSAHERNQEVLSVLRKQMAALEEQKEAARRLKEEEAQLLVMFFFTLTFSQLMSRYVRYFIIIGTNYIYTLLQ